MANSWLRLWHDMPNDPKWRTIARLSGQPVALVQATYLHLLVSASQNVTRGHANVTHEDLASALDVTERDISLILDAMQGRVLEGSCLSGWEKRQVKRDDSGNPATGAMSAAERKRAQRERQRLAKEKEECHGESHDVTTDKDKDKDKDLKDKTPHNAHVREGDFLPDDQPFPMFEDWKPSGKAQQEYNSAELEDFVLFWQSGKQEFNQDQWEQKFTRSVQRYREHAKTKKPGGSHAKQNTANASAFEQVRARHNEWRISQGLALLGDDGGDLCQPMGSQERSGTLHDLGPDDFAVLG
jgi:hypothetical protein